MLRFAEPRRLGDDGLYWLRIHLANLFGLSKAPLAARHKFCVDHADEIRDSYQNPMDGNKWWLEADEPWQALAACRELAQAAELPDPRDYECSLPVRSAERHLWNPSILPRRTTPGFRRRKDYHGSRRRRGCDGGYSVEAGRGDAAAATWIFRGGLSSSRSELGRRPQVHMDGSCNGLQHYAALGRDRAGGLEVNLLPGEAPRDVYEGVRSLVAEKVAADAARGAARGYSVPDMFRPRSHQGFGKAADVADDPFDDESGDDPDDAASVAAAQDAADAARRAQIVDGMVTRKVVKQTVMTSVYGVTFVGARQQILARLTDVVEDMLSKPEEHADDIARLKRLGAITEEGDVDENELYHCACYVAGLTLEVLAELFTSARHIMGWLAECARLITLDHEQPVSWITPLGLPVVQPYRRDGHHAVRTLAQTVLLIDHSSSLPVSVTRQKSAFPPNYVHSLDSTHMLMTATEMDHRGLRFTAVHDSYWTHAADVPVMNETLRRCFLDLYEAPLLEQLLESFRLRYPGTKFPELPPRGDLDITEVLDADYFFS